MSKRKLTIGEKLRTLRDSLIVRLIKVEESLIKLNEIGRVKTMINILIDLLKATKDKDTKAMILQSYITEYGPVPNEYGDIIKDILADCEVVNND